jgi:hypothetical protein
VFKSTSEQDSNTFYHLAPEANFQQQTCIFPANFVFLLLFCILDALCSTWSLICSFVFIHPSIFLLFSIEMVRCSCLKVKKSSSKENYAAKYAPLFCEIWFINKGKHVWTREASENSNPLPKCDHAENMSFETLRSESLRYSKSNLPFQKNNLRSNSAARISCARISGFVQNESVCAESVLPTIYSSYSSWSCHPLQSSSSSCAPGCTSTERRVSSGSDSKLEEESSHSHVEEVRLETEALGNESFEDFLKRKMLEAISKVTALQYSWFISEFSLQIMWLYL